MKRIFGTKAPQAPGVTMDEVTGRMNERSTALDTRIENLDKQLARYSAQIKAAKTTGARNAAKQQALRILKQKRQLEGQRGQMCAQQMNLESAAFMTQQLQDTADQVSVMKQAQSAISKQMAHVNIDEVEALQDKMQDLYYDQEEIQEVLGRSFAVDADVDEDELLGELDLIESELATAPDGLADAAADAAGAVPAFLEEPDLPAVPAGAASAAPAAAHERPIGV